MFEGWDETVALAGFMPAPNIPCGEDQPRYSLGAGCFVDAPIIYLQEVSIYMRYVHIGGEKQPGMIRVVETHSIPKALAI